MANVPADHPGWEEERQQDLISQSPWPASLPISRKHLRESASRDSISDTG